MINLLPSEEKDKLLLEQKKRIAIILWFLVLFFIICLILILFAAEIYLKSQLESQKTILIEVQKEYGQPEIQNLKEEIKEANSILIKLNSFYQKKIYFAEILERVSQTLPQGTYLTNFSAIFSKEVLKISLSGFALARENLFEFKKNLEKEEDFKEVFLPPANWVKPANIDFFVTFELNI